MSSDHSAFFHEHHLGRAAANFKNHSVFRAEFNVLFFQNVGYSHVHKAIFFDSVYDSYPESRGTQDFIHYRIFVLCFPKCGRSYDSRIGRNYAPTSQLLFVARQYMKTKRLRFPAYDSGCKHIPAQGNRHFRTVKDISISI